MMRQRWSSRTMFLFAAIGSAVGLGNVWRFPYLAYKFGGGAFLVPYLIALLVMGIPLLMLELMLGQKLQAGGVKAFKKINPRFEGIGFAGIFLSFIVVAYYAAVMAWMLIYLLQSFQNPLPWLGDTKAFFFDNTLQISSGIEVVGSINSFTIASLFAVWVMIYFCVWKGVESAEKVIKITAPLPIFILILLFIRGITLEGAMHGIAYYIKPNFSLLWSSEIWIAAASQIFFTLSLALGVMIAYASYNKKEQCIKKDAWVISIVNSSISLFAGFVVFSIIGYMSLETGKPVSEVAVSGPGLAFVVFPKALSLMPAPNLVSIMFFLMLLTLGIDSAFSLVEAINTSIKDVFKNVTKERIAFYVCSVAFGCGVIFCTQAGLYFLDVIDHFIVEFGLVFLGLIQCLSIAWGYGANRLREEVNSFQQRKIGALWAALVKYVIPIFLMGLLIEQGLKEMKVNYEGYPNWAIAFA
ncbi:MAG: sodium-dependent transporter [Chlamydiales bacterium]|nr:sodium-dependent transporter [Chlamydiales bacterium]